MSLSLSCAASKTTFLPFFTVCPWFRWKMWKVYTQGFLLAGMIMLPALTTSEVCFPNLDAVFGLLRPESDTARSSSVFRGHMGARRVVSLFLKGSYEAEAQFWISILSSKWRWVETHNIVSPLPPQKNLPKLQLLCFSNFNFSNGKEWAWWVSVVERAPFPLLILLYVDMVYIFFNQYSNCHFLVLKAETKIVPC